MANILRVSGLKKYFPIRKGLLKQVSSHLKAVDGVDFTLQRGETLGLVGESGSGKTTLGRCVVGLYKPTAGTVEFAVDGEMRNLWEMNRRELHECRRHFQMLFQDPYSSLNARLTIGDIICEPLVVHDVGTPAERRDRARELLQKVGLSADQVSQYPHQFSGGQRQRIGIARALSINPDLVVCDEPVSALDVSVQAQVLNLLIDLQKEYNLSYLFIAHDLSVVEYISDRIMVMYLGKIVEFSTAEAIYRKPKHPYSEALLAAISKYQPGSRRKILVSGSIPDSSDPPSGCVFHTRCRYAQPVCRNVVPELEAVEGTSEAAVACHRFRELDLKGYI